MKYALAQAALVYTGLAVVARAELPKTWNKDSKWQVEIQAPVKLPARPEQKMVPDAGIWDIDLWHAVKNPSIVDGLHDRGKTVICYFNLGAVQPNDCDFTEDWYNDKENLWQGPWYFDGNGGEDENDRYCERYENFTQTNIMDRMKHRLNKAAAAGCDGVDPDNIDIWEVNWDNDGEVQETAVVDALKELAAHAHNLTTKLKNKLMIGQKNAPTIASQLASVFDFAVLENCQRDKPFCGDFKSYLNAGKPVVDIEYPDSLQDDGDKVNKCNRNGISGDDRKVVCPTLTGPLVNMTRVLKLNFDEFGLNGCTQYCDSGVVVTPTNSSQDAICSYEFDNCDATLKKNKCC